MRVININYIFRDSFNLHLQICFPSGNYILSTHFLLSVILITSTSKLFCQLVQHNFSKTCLDGFWFLMSVYNAISRLLFILFCFFFPIPEVTSLVNAHRTRKIDDNSTLLRTLIHNPSNNLLSLHFWVLCKFQVCVSAKLYGQLCKLCSQWLLACSFFFSGLLFLFI